MPPPQAPFPSRESREPGCGGGGGAEPWVISICRVPYFETRNERLCLVPGGSVPDSENAPGSERGVPGQSCSRTPLSWGKGCNPGNGGAGRAAPPPTEASCQPPRPLWTWGGVWEHKSRGQQALGPPVLALPGSVGSADVIRAALGQADWSPGWGCDVTLTGCQVWLLPWSRAAQGGPVHHTRSWLWSSLHVLPGTGESKQRMFL